MSNMFTSSGCSMIVRPPVDSRLNNRELKELKQLIVAVEDWARKQNISSDNWVFTFEGLMTFDGVLFQSLGAFQRPKPVPVLKRKKRYWWLPFRKGGGRG